MKGSIARIVTGLAVFASIATGIMTITGFLSRFGWILELTCHFRVQYLAVQLICSILIFIVRRWKWALVILLFVGINMAQIVPLYIPHQKSADRAAYEKLKLVLINVNTANTQYDKVVEYVEEKDPDLLALMEIDRQWLSSLSPMLEDFPFQKTAPRSDNFGIGLFSRIALQEPAIRYFGYLGEADLPSVVSKLHISGQSVTVLVTHPYPPVTSHSAQLRDRQLEEIAAARQEFDDTLVVMGDLNMTSWSHYYQRFASSMGLYDTRKGFGLQVSWPTAMPPMLITLDHCLVSKDITVSKRETGPNVGSDHYPVYVELEL